jgi:hypothetical protein
VGLLLCVCTGHDSIEIANVYILMVFTVFWKGDSLYLMQLYVVNSLILNMGILGGAVTIYIYITIYIYVLSSLSLLLLFVLALLLLSLLLYTCNI